MLEFRTMGYADFYYPNHDAENTAVIYDTEKERVKLFRSYMDDEDSSQDEWRVPGEDDHFFPTKEEAAQALDNRRKELFDKMAEVKKYVKMMEDWEVEEGEPFYHEYSDYLPYTIAYSLSDDNWVEKERSKFKKRLRYLVDYVQTGFMNIGARTFRKEDVECVRWGSEKARLCIKDDVRAITIDETERWFVEIIFGENNGGNVFPDLENP